MEEDLLGDLISAADSLTNEEKPSNGLKNASVKEINIFDKEESEVRDKVVSTSSIKDAGSVVHTGLSDSSDDEDSKYFEEAKYNAYGRDIKKLINTRHEKLEPKNTGGKWTLKPSTSDTKQLSLQPSKNVIIKDSFVDPVFGIRIVNPLVSSKVLQERMVGRESVSLAKLKWYIHKLTPDKDWVIGAVVVQKSASKTSQKGNQFSIWSLSDLHGDLKTVSVFLFGKAYQELWKTAVGTVVGILNPNILDKKDGSKDEACLSIDTHQKVMILGQSKDLGMCKSTRKSGEKCTAFINTNQGDHCIYHIKQEYEKYSKRSNMQNPFASRGLTTLRNKVLGKNEVFYAGKIYAAIPATKSKKLSAKDENRLTALKNKVATKSDHGVKSNVRRKGATNVEMSKKQRTKDLALLRKLGANSELDISLDKKGEFNASVSHEVTLAESKATTLNVINKLREKQIENKCNDDGDNNSRLSTNEDGLLDVFNGKEFDGMISKEVTLEDSKKLAVNTISKLKMKNCTVQNSENKNISDVLHKQNNVEEENITEKYNSPIEMNSETECVVKASVSNGNSKETILKQQNVASNAIHNNSAVPKEINKSRPFLTSSLPVPSLSNNGQATVDLSSPISRKVIDKAKLNALKYVQKNGQIKKSDPMRIKGTGRKRMIDDANLADETDPKRRKIQENEFFSDRFKKLMAATSSHTDLIEQHEDEEKEKYFKKLEIKEKMEEKMASTFKVQCKAVRCLKCKYTSFSASDKCKAERHPLKVFDTSKRFFKCGHCGNRTVCLEVVPTVACKNCGSGKWERTSMMKEKNVKSLHNLSIRGGEQKFTNSSITNSNLDLLVPSN